MPIADIHDLFQAQCPDGVGIAVSWGDLEGAAAKIVDRLSHPTPQVNSDVPLPQYPRVRFSFLLDLGRFQLRANGHLDLGLTVTLHPAGRPDLPIVTLDMSITDVPLAIGADPVSGNLRWTAPANVPVIGPPVWGPDANLISAGYVTAGGGADRPRFEEEIYYGFVWITSANFVSGIVANIPIPQVQDWITAFTMGRPLSAQWLNGYLLVWASATANSIICGPTLPPMNSNVPARWQSAPVPPGVLSKFDDTSPRLLLYISAQRLLDWTSAGVMPAVMFNASGGGYIQWNFRAAAGLASITLDLTPSATGGTLALTGVLDVLGDASAWIDGPCGTTLASVDESLKATASLQANLSASFDPSTLSIDVDAALSVAIDPASVELGGGGLPWPIQPVVNDIISFLVQRGAIQLPTAYARFQHSYVLDLSQIAGSKKDLGTVLQRVADRSVLFGISLRKP
jgi:hypothetical protein